MKFDMFISILDAGYFCRFFIVRQFKKKKKNQIKFFKRIFFWKYLKCPSVLDPDQV